MYINGGEFVGSLEGTNLPGDATLVLTSDPKPRLRWTAELHDRFIDAVAQLGGPESEPSFSLISGASFLLLRFGLSAVALISSNFRVKNS